MSGHDLGLLLMACVIYALGAGCQSASSEPYDSVWALGWTGHVTVALVAFLTTHAGHTGDPMRAFRIEVWQTVSVRARCACTDHAGHMVKRTYAKFVGYFHRWDDVIRLVTLRRDCRIRSFYDRHYPGWVAQVLIGKEP